RRISRAISADREIVGLSPTKAQRLGAKRHKKPCNIWMQGLHSALIVTLGGIAIFMLGMNTASENLQKIAADRIRDIVTTLAKKPVCGVFLGIGLTMILQSSGATTTLLVGLGSAAVINLPQVMSVILGA